MSARKKLGLDPDSNVYGKLSFFYIFETSASNRMTSTVNIILNKKAVTKVEAVMIEKEVREVEEFRYELLHIVDVAKNNINGFIVVSLLKILQKRCCEYCNGLLDALKKGSGPILPNQYQCITGTDSSHCCSGTSGG